MLFSGQRLTESQRSTHSPKNLERREFFSEAALAQKPNRYTKMLNSVNVSGLFRQLVTYGSSALLALILR